MMTTDGAAWFTNLGTNDTYVMSVMHTGVIDNCFRDLKGQRSQPPHFMASKKVDAPTEGNNLAEALKVWAVTL